MSSYAPSPHGSGNSSTRVRVRWDNVMIVLIGAVVAAFAVVAILMSAERGGTKPTAKAPTNHANHESTTSSIDEANAGDLSLDDAVDVVAEMRSLMTEGRWDEAADRLELIPADLRDASGASLAEQELTRLSAQHDALRSQLAAAVEARNFTDARDLLKQLAALAPLDAELAKTQELVDTALTPKGAAAKDDAKQDQSATKNSTSASGGGATTPTKPTAKPASGGAKPSSGTKPSTGGAKPSSGATRPTTTGGGSSTPSAGSGTTPSAGSAGAGTSGAADTGTPNIIGDLGQGIQLTPEQEADLADALEAAMAGL